MDIPRDLFHYSSTLNVLHFIMDHFQTDVLLEIIRENSWEGKLEGFTLFRENLASSNTTSIGIPPILTGDLFDGKCSIAEYFRKSIADNGFQNALFNEGFKLNVVPNINIPMKNVANHYKIPQGYYGSASGETVSNTIYAGLHSIFRLSTQWIKKINRNQKKRHIVPINAKSPDSQIRSVFSFLQVYIDHIEVNGPKPVFHFIYIFPPHPPYVINKDGNYVGEILAPTRENFKIQATYTLKHFLDLLKKLRELGLYDSALMILQSDHGSQTMPIKNGAVCDIEMQKAPAMLAIKPPNARTPVTISDAQTMNSDVPATIMDILHLNYSFNGTSVFRINPSENRQRYFITGKKEKFLVYGSLYDQKSWSKVANIIAAMGTSTYRYHSTVQFGLMGNAEEYQGVGWSVPSDNCEWNDGIACSMIFFLEDTCSDILLKATFIPYLPKGIIDKQRVNILVNGKHTGQWVITKEGTQKQSVIIPQKYLTGKKMLLEFIFPDALSPQSMHLSPDERILALAMINMILAR